MKLYLFGGAETDQGQAPILKKLINDVLDELHPKQLLHIPYARIEVPEEEKDIWGEGWLSRDLTLEGITLLDARNEKDLKSAEKPVVFMNGGFQRDNLYKEIIKNKHLYRLVMKAEYLIGESAGSTVCGEYRCTDRNNVSVITKGLGILKNTIIKAHYTQRNRHQVLRNEMKESGVKYGLGIDSITGVVIDTRLFPYDYQVIGEGNIDIIKREELYH